MVVKLESDLWYAHGNDSDNLVHLGALIKRAVYDAPTPDVLLPLCEWYYGYHGAGGWLHIVLDDENLEDSSVQFCVAKAEEEGDIVCKCLALLIAQLTVDQREELYNKLRGDS